MLSVFSSSSSISTQQQKQQILYFAMETLCSFCDKIRFDVLGFHEPMFYPNSYEDPEDFEDLEDPHELCRESWQKERQITLSTVLDGQQVPCDFCRSIVQLLEDRLKEQDTIPNSLQELGAEGAVLVVDYRSEPALRPNFPDWELTRLQVLLKLPKPMQEALRTKDAVNWRSYWGDSGPNVFIVLQSAEAETIEESIEYREDFASWTKEEEFGFGWSAAELLGEGRSRPCVFNANVVNYWREFCEEKHGIHKKSHCWKQEKSIVDRILGLEANDHERVLGMRVIDVQKRCIVDYDWDWMEPYYTLSYVWGTHAFLTLNKANEADLRKEGSLSQELLPDTIADAMEVVRNIDAMYLWVDNLCILQDDDADKERFINRMGTIYREADTTIIALCGEDAYSGLPGVRKDRPRILQQEIEIKGVRMLPVMMPTGWNDAYKLGETKWTTRAWTHQEVILSRRRLIFGREQAYFICGESILCEDVVGPDFSPFIDTFALLQLYGSALPYNAKHQTHFQQIITAYTKRQLTHRKDRLNGISGILEQISRTGGPFFQGIPLSCFSNAILWDRDFIWSGFPRLIDEKSCQEESGLRIAGLPSWSWVGWMGHIRFAKDFDDKPVNGQLRFYGFTPNEGLIELEALEHKIAQKEAWGSFLGGPETPYSCLPKEFWDFERTEVKLEDLPASVPDTPLLCFWTNTATIDLEVVEKKKCFKTSTGKLVGLGMRVFVPCGEVKKLELIVLGEQLNATPAVAVIAIRWENGIAYREPFGLETVGYCNWNDIENRCWKRIIMG
jgi:hypothetical protein